MQLASPAGISSAISKTDFEKRMPLTIEDVLERLPYLPEP